MNWNKKSNLKYNTHTESTGVLPHSLLQRLRSSFLFLRPRVGTGPPGLVLIYCRNQTLNFWKVASHVWRVWGAGAAALSPKWHLQNWQILQWMRKLPPLFKHAYPKGTLCGFFPPLEIAGGASYISHPGPGGTCWLLMEFMVFTSCHLCGKKERTEVEHREKGERQGCPIHVPTSLTVLICLSREGTNTWLWGAQYLWKQWSVRSGGRGLHRWMRQPGIFWAWTQASLTCTTWLLLSAGPSRFQACAWLKNQKGFPPSFCSRDTGAKVGFKHLC